MCSRYCSINCTSWFISRICWLSIIFRDQWRCKLELMGVIFHENLSVTELGVWHPGQPLSFFFHPIRVPIENTNLYSSSQNPVPIKALPETGHIFSHYATLMKFVNSFSDFNNYFIRIVLFCLGFLISIFFLYNLSMLRIV